jgi:hypothetical protein
LRPAAENAEKADKKRAYLNDVNPAAANQAWRRFLGRAGAAAPGREAGRDLAAVPAIVSISRSDKEYIVSCAQRAEPDRV